MDLHHINIQGPRELLEKEKKFFCDIIGLQEGYRPDFSNIGCWLYANGKAIVHLTESDNHFKNDKQGYFDHVAFQSTDVQKLVSNLEEKEIKYTITYLSKIDMTQVFFKSPSGTGIEINFENEKV